MLMLGAHVPGAGHRDAQGFAAAEASIVAPKGNVADGRRQLALPAVAFAGDLGKEIGDAGRS